MRTFMYWYMRTLEALFFPLIAFVALLRGLLYFGVFTAPEGSVAAVTAFFDAYGLWVMGALTFAIALTSAGMMQSKFLTKTGARPLWKFYDGELLFGCLYFAIPLGIWFVPVVLLQGVILPSSVTLAVVFSLISGLVVGTIFSPVVGHLVRPGWELEHLDALKAETTKALRLHGAVMEEDAEVAMDGMSYKEVSALKGQCSTIARLTKDQEKAYNALQATMEKRGVKPAYGAAFAGKTSAELMAEDES